MKSLLIKSLITLTLVSSASAMASGDIILFCKPAAGVRIVQAIIGCSAEGTDCSFSSRKFSERRRDIVNLQILSAGHGQVTLGNSLSNIKVEMTSEAPRSATVFNSNGVLAECSEN